METTPQVEIELTSEQEQKMLETWNKNPSNPPGLKELTQAIFGAEHDGRSFEGRAIKKALARHNLKAVPIHEKPAKIDTIELSEAHKTFIENNARTMNPLEMARQIFSNPTLSNLNAETRLVAEHIKKQGLRDVYNPEAVQDIPTDSYRPPMTMDQTLKRVNQYIFLGPSKDKLTLVQKKNLETLMSYLGTFRFTAMMNSYDSAQDRKLCEDAFVRYTFDKPDLSQEEVDQYIVLCNEVVMSFKIQRRSETLQQRLEDLSNDTDMKISMSLVEAIGKAQSDYNSCVKRQQDLLGDLKEKRSKRLDKAVKDNASILNLIQLWKQEETRKQLLAIAQKEQDKIAEEVDKLSCVADVKARILGLTKAEIKHG